MSICVTPSGRSASRIAWTTVWGAPMQPACPAPLTPSGFSFVGNSISDSSKSGRSMARGMA